MTLREIINRIENTSDELVIFTAKADGRWSLDAPASLIALSAVDEVGTDFEGLQYFLEIEIAREVLDVWKWRHGRIPTEKEKFEALTHYADNDAYLET